MLPIWKVIECMSPIRPEPPLTFMHFGPGITHWIVSDLVSSRLAWLRYMIWTFLRTCPTQKVFLHSWRPSDIDTTHPRISQLKTDYTHISKGDLVVFHSNSVDAFREFQLLSDSKSNAMAVLVCPPEICNSFETVPTPEMLDPDRYELRMPNTVWLARCSSSAVIERFIALYECWVPLQWSMQPKKFASEIFERLGGRDVWTFRALQLQEFGLFARFVTLSQNGNGWIDMSSGSYVPTSASSSTAS